MFSQKYEQKHAAKWLLSGIYIHIGSNTKKQIPEVLFPNPQQLFA